MVIGELKVVRELVSNWDPTQAMTAPRSHYASFQLGHAIPEHRNSDSLQLASHWINVLARSAAEDNQCRG